MNIPQELLDGKRTADETWVYGYEVKTKLQSSQWKSKKTQVRSNCEGLAHSFSYNSVFKKISLKLPKRKY